MFAMCEAGAWPWGMSVGRGRGGEIICIKTCVLAEILLTGHVQAEDIIYWQHNLAQFKIFDFCHLKQWREVLHACEQLVSRAANEDDEGHFRDYDRLYWYTLCVMGDHGGAKNPWSTDHIVKYVVRYAADEPDTEAYYYRSPHWMASRHFEFHYFSRLVQLWLRNELMTVPPLNLEHELSLSGCTWLVEMGKPWSIATSRDNVWHDSTISVARLVLVYLVRHVPHGVLPEVVAMISGYYAHAMRRYPSPQQISYFGM